MKLFVLVAALALSACTTVVPVTQPFPVAPEELLKRCPQLNTVPAGQTSLADMLKVVISNYQLYYECAARNEGWQDWYSEQKKIFDSIK